MSSSSPSRVPRSLNRMNSSSNLQLNPNPRLSNKRSRSKIRSYPSNSSNAHSYQNGVQHAAHPLEGYISQVPANGIVQSLKELRYMVLVEGIPADGDGMSPLRAYVWSIFMGVAPLSANNYLNLVHAGPSRAYAKIRDDTFRTLATDPLFRRRVSEQSITRLLNSYVIARDKKKPDKTTKYVQGMNVMAAPFLYTAKSEHEAYALFETFVRRECPSYVRPTLDGVHKGLQLVDKVLEIVDQELFDFLAEHRLEAKVYAFPSVMTFSACTPPLPEVCILWDFLLAYGAHLNILCVVAQLVAMKEELMASSSPIKLLRQFPHLKARSIIATAVNFIPQLPDALYEELINHPKTA